MTIQEGNSLVPVRPAGLIGMDPVALVAAATEVAETLAKVLEDQHLYTDMGQSKHVRIEGWLTAGAMLQVFPHVVAWDVIRNTDGLTVGCSATAEARTMDGRVVSTATALCTRDEPTKRRKGGVFYKWADAPVHQVLSMAQTRAASKAMGLALRWVITMAGFSGTPAEEIDPDAEPSDEVQPEAPPSTEYLAGDPALKEAVLPAEPPRARVPRTPQRGRSRRAPEPSGGLDKPEPWSEFYAANGILPAQAVTMIRSKLPEALGPEEEEAEGWPATGTQEEVEAAVRKLEAMDDQRAIGAQAMLREVMAGARKEQP